VVDEPIICGDNIDTPMIGKIAIKTTQANL
jgi:hypothetical protein